MKKMQINSMNDRVGFTDPKPIRKALFNTASSVRSQYSHPKNIATPSPTHVYKVEVSLRTILYVILIVAGIYFGYKLLQVIFVLFLAFSISCAVLPLIRKLERRGLKKSVGIALVYSTLSLAVIVLALLVLLPVGHEINTLNERFPSMLDNLSHNIAELLSSLLGVNIDQKSIFSTLKDLYKNSLSGQGSSLVSGGISTLQKLGGIGDLIGSLFLAAAISVYMVADHDNFLDLLLLQIVDSQKRALAKKLVRDVEEKLGSWLIGQGALCLIVGFLTWLVLTILGVPFALPLAVLAAIFEIIPTLGPWIAAIPAIIVAFVFSGPVIAVLVAVGSILIQQAENLFLVPRIMGNVAGVKPIVVFVGLIVGFSLAGVAGVILAVPVLVLAKIAYEFYASYEKLKATGQI